MIDATRVRLSQLFSDAFGTAYRSVKSLEFNGKKKELPCEKSDDLMAKISLESITGVDYLVSNGEVVSDHLIQSDTPGKKEIDSDEINGRKEVWKSIADKIIEKDISATSDKKVETSDGNIVDHESFVESGK